MEFKARKQIAIGLFTGSTISLFLIVNNLTKNILQKLLIISILITLILISFKVIRYPSISLGFMGDRLRKIGL